MSHSDSYFIFLNKPEGQSSQQCLSAFRRRFHIKKIGHHGTLDPFASGLLLAGVNEAAKFFRFVDDRRKTYEATLKFGVRTATLDHTGAVLEERVVPDLTLAQLEAACAALRGRIRQRPPMYSAVKVGGEKLYELARRGLEVEREEREIEVYRLEILKWAPPYLDIRAEVSRGTYIRVLAEQIAAALDNVAHLTRLVRTVLCGVGLEAALSGWQDFEAVPEHCKISPERLFAGSRGLTLTQRQFQDLRCGRPTPGPFDGLPSVSDTEAIPLFYQGHFFGVGTLAGDKLKSLRLINPDLTEFS